MLDQRIEETVSYRTKEDGTKVKVITRKRITTYSKKVYHSVVNRKNTWINFGQAALDNTGVTTLSEEDVFMLPPPQPVVPDEEQFVPPNPPEYLMRSHEPDKEVVKDGYKDRKKEPGIKVYNPDTTIRVTGLSTDLLEPDIYDLFSKYGKIECLYMPRDFKTKNPKGITFITYSNSKSADDSVKYINGRCYEHVVIKVVRI